MNDPAEPLVLFGMREGIGTVTINRPRVLNAVNLACADRLREVIAKAASLPNLRVLMVTGAGRGFSAGADLTPGADSQGRDEAPGNADIEGTWNQLIRELATFPCPTIAAVNGVAVGAGLSIALACDIRVVSADARMGAVFARRGLMPDTGSTFLVPHVVRWDRAILALMTGRILDAPEADRFGFCTELAPAGRALARAEEVAAEIAAAAPLPVRHTRRLLHTRFEEALDRGLNEELPYVLECLETEDAVEGATAFLEKRPARFVGR